tara:strand:- start:550 stop:1515 length:966 start_codon:yes stop_codon:yes gene_type:complete
MKLKIFEGFAGASGHPKIEAGWTKEARKRGHIVKLGELENLWYEPDLHGDILDFTAQDILNLFDGEPPDICCFSPPCEGFSIAGAISSNWSDWDKEKKDNFNRARWNKDYDYFNQPNVGPTPTSERSIKGRELLLHTLKIIDDLLEINPFMLYFIENPTGMMRYQPELAKRFDLLPPFEQGLGPSETLAPSPSITHSSYAGPLSKLICGREGHLVGHSEGTLPSRKATDIFTNAWPAFEGRRRSKNGIHAGIYHASAPRGAKTGIQGLNDWIDEENGIVIGKYWLRSLIPYELGVDMINAAEAIFSEDYEWNTDTANMGWF